MDEFDLSADAERRLGYGAPTLLKGRVSKRVAVVNFRTREDDLRALLDEATHAGREIA